MPAHQNAAPADTPKISAVIVTYNAAATLQASLDSIFKQSYPNIEIVVIDGQSTDDTLTILQQNDERIAFWLSEKDTGIYDAMNKAIKYVTGQWVYFLGADDELLPGFSDFAADLQDNNTIYYGNVLTQGEVRPGKLSDYHLAKMGIYHQAMIYPASVFEKYSFNTKYRISADFALNIRLFGDKAYRFSYVDRLIAFFNHTGVSGTQVDKPFRKDKAGLIFKHFGFKIWSRYMFRLLKGKIKGDSNPHL